ncbi:TlpA family protein disulfide reductase [Terrimonas sp. NA20]|uniref:TlpA family protein disulfide reductase n=1 Tax=Terrimonas ginsenosidimutans TaxID=2908004 RepID=A0ABS9KYQ8_9BACT|nr:TlpA disulfide reductase family protein [Terrimonas ginsenosidimutans]MCG2617519.1 TlpA family protein disulfide reductase [Terrimonas ginsenosidimutans]
MKKSLVVLLVTLIAGSHEVMAQTFSPFGKWRGVFQLRDGVEAPFNFEITGKSIADAKVFFINAAERFDGGRVRRQKDSLFISLDQFDNELAFKINGNQLDGVLRKTDGSGSPLKVTAEKGKLYRFPVNGAEPAGDISGTYDIVSGKDSTVGLFTQKGSKLSATFLSITGDSRYLDGIVDGNKFYLSSFIGSGVAYYQGTFNNDGTITGEQVSPRGARKFAGRENDEAKLPDLYSLTYLKQGYNRFDFSFPDIDGNKVSLTDEKYKGKAVIIAITGSWCPNCMDETAFLSPWYKKNRSRGVEIVAIHYERKDDPAFVKNAIGRYRKKFDIRYDQVFGGLADKQFVANSLPSLNTFLSFPTTIFINKKGEVAKIHTGYTGPATGRFYTEFVKEFNEEVDHLLAD